MNPDYHSKTVPAELRLTEVIQVFTLDVPFDPQEPPLAEERGKEQERADINITRSKTSFSIP